MALQTDLYSPELFEVLLRKNYEETLKEFNCLSKTSDKIKFNCKTFQKAWVQEAQIKNSEFLNYEEQFP